MSSEIIPDTEWALREWLRTELPAVKVYMDPPRGGNATFPMITLGGRLGGGLDSTRSMDQPFISFSVWGSPGGAGRAQAQQTVSLLAEAIEGADNIDITPDVHLYGGRVDNLSWRPDDSDPDNVIPRYVLDATFGVRST